MSSVPTTPTAAGSPKRRASRSHSRALLIPIPSVSASNEDWERFFTERLAVPLKVLLAATTDELTMALVVEKVGQTVAAKYAVAQSVRIVPSLVGSLAKVINGAGVEKKKAHKAAVFVLSDVYTAIEDAVEAAGTKDSHLETIASGALLSSSMDTIGSTIGSPTARTSPLGTLTLPSPSNKTVEALTGSDSPLGSTPGASGDVEFSLKDIEIFESVGEGAMGKIHRGRLWGTDVAVKTIKPEHVSPEVMEELTHEIRILRQLRHPHIVLYIAAITQPPEVCVITEFLEGGSVFDLIHNADNIIDFREVIRIALSCALGVNYLHEHNPPILHRDLKSLNLLISESGTVKVCDFGLSWRGASQAEGRYGTAQWMAPEMIMEQRYDEKVDVYSFGVLVLELVTRQLPYADRYAGHDFLPAVLRGEGPSIPSVWVMGPLNALVEACLSPDPTARPPFSSICAELRAIDLVEPDIIDVADVRRVTWWLDSDEEFLHAVAATQLAAMDSNLVGDHEKSFMRRLSSFLWKADGDLLTRVVEAVANLVRTDRLLDSFAAIEGVPLLMSRITIDDVDAQTAVLETLAMILTADHAESAEQAREALVGLGMLKPLFMLQNEPDARGRMAAVILSVLSADKPSSSALSDGDDDEAGGALGTSPPSPSVAPSTPKRLNTPNNREKVQYGSPLSGGGIRRRVSSSGLRVERTGYLEGLALSLATECRSLEDGPKDVVELAAVELTSVLSTIKSLGGPRGPTNTIQSRLRNLRDRQRSKSMSGPSTPIPQRE